MNKSYLLLSLFAFLLLNVSCVKDVVEQEQLGGVISFVPEFAAATRATDTYFETGDEISVYALKGTTLEPSGNYADNVRYSYLNYKFTPAGSGIELDGDGLNFLALYPYDPYYSDTFKYTVWTDQSSHKLYTGSDFMFAVGRTVAETEVALKFTHCCSKIVIDMSLADYVPSNSYIELSDVAIEALFDMNALTYQTTDKRGYVRMCPDGTNRFKAIVAPQTFKEGGIAGTLVSDYDKYIIRLDNDIYLQSGQETTLYLHNSSGNEYVLSTSRVNDNYEEWFKQTVYLENDEELGTYEYNSVHVLWEAENVTSIKYGLFKAAASTTYSDSAIMEYLNDAPDSYLNYINTNGYLGIYYTNLEPYTEYEMVTYAIGIAGNTAKSVMKREVIRTAAR